MEEIKIGDKALVEMNVAGWDKNTGDYQMRPKEYTRTFWASKEMVHPMTAKTYDDGLREAWEMARKIICSMYCGGFSPLQIEEIFGCHDFDDVLINYTPQEAAAKIAEWEDGKVIHVGDVVQNKNTGVKGLITVKDGEKDFHILFEDGRSGRYLNHKDSLKKTGRTIDISGLLAQIGGTEDA